MPEEQEYSDIVVMPARVITTFREVPALQYNSQQTLNLDNQTAVLDVIKTHAADPSIFDEYPPFIWVAEISNNTKDYYNTKMDVETTLKNFVEDAIAGVTFLDSHVQSEKLGRSFAAIQVQNGEDVSDYAAFYTIPDVSSSRNNTNDLIKRIRSGIEKDVSVGFKRGEGFMMRCSVCGLDMWRDWDCEHFSGQRIKIWDEDNNVSREVTVYATVVNGRLAEVSGVYDGATPKSMIGKAVNFAQRGLLKPETIRFLETTYRMVLPEKTPLISGIEARHTNKEKETKMASEGENPNLETFRGACVEMRIVKAGSEILNFDDGLRVVREELTRLRKVEDERNQFFRDVVDEAITEGIRAYGADFKKEHYTGILERLTLSEVKEFTKEWQAKADSTLGGGKRSVDDEEKSDDTKDTDNNKPADEKRDVSQDFYMPEDIYRS